MSNRLTADDVHRKTKAFNTAATLVWGWLEQWPLDVECSRNAQRDLTALIAAAIEKGLK